MKSEFQATERFAREMDVKDPLRRYREEFIFPMTRQGHDCLYFSGNSLGLQPKKAKSYIEQELEDWGKLGVEGHLHARKPWLPYHENLTDQTARLVGALPTEVVTMNTLSVNLHLLMVSFYRPTKQRFKILIEAGAFPSDQYAVASQAKYHGYDPDQAILELKPRPGEATLRTEDILATIDRVGDEISLILLGNVNYLTGQAFDCQAIARAGRAKGCNVGFDLAHGAGNLLLKLHDWEVDFAAWCSYKYLNAGPGAVAGVFVHERHFKALAKGSDLPRFEGWWGHNKATRFQMGPIFDPIPSAEAWQLSNPPIFQLAALRASMEIFDSATMPEIRKKGDLLTGYLEYLLDLLPKGYCTIITPRDLNQRGSQLSLKIKGDPRVLQQELSAQGVIADFREPDILRFAPAPLYNSFFDVFRLAEVLKKNAKG
jgi:kynureninase